MSRTSAVRTLLLVMAGLAASSPETPGVQLVSNKKSTR